MLQGKGSAPPDQHDELPGRQQSQESAFAGSTARIALLRGNKLVGLFDTKYRDLWETPLPRDMLYQLAIYALSQGERRAATILYPTTSPAAKEQVIDIREPLAGSARGAVILRPVQLPKLASAVSTIGMAGERHRTALASSMAAVA